MYHESLIKNDAMSIQFNWDFDGAEVDLLAKAATGKKQVIDGDAISIFVQGMLEAVICAQLTSDEDKRAYMVASLKSQGRTDEYINSYLRGWDSVGAITDPETPPHSG